jgi:hypothetical protein
VKVKLGIPVREEAEPASAKAASATDKK